MAKNNNQRSKPRMRMPKKNEVLGVIEKLLGYAKMRVKCADGKTRVCRVPGRLTRSLWLRERDVVIVKPWDLQSDTKGDILYKYRRGQVKYLRRKGLLKGLEEEL